MKFDANIFLCYQAHYYEKNKFCINCFVRYLLPTAEKGEKISISVSEFLYLSFMEIYEKYKVYLL
jgi:hypothetical protein